jgi:hypothetical protein
VPGDVVTIKAAVEDSAAYGDTVLVSPGVYDTTSAEAFPMVMKNGVVLKSTDGPAVTFIDANLTGRVFNCISLDSTTVISGFTITGGVETEGGGIYCLDSDLEISDNIITGNAATDVAAHGGGLFLSGGAPSITSNQIVSNKARKNMGGGIFCAGGSTALIKDNLITRNVAKYGGGIFMQYCRPTVRGNTVSRNRSIATGAGVDCSFNSSPVVTHNVIVHNTANADGSGIACCYGTTPTIAYNTIAGNSGTFGGGVRALGNSSPEIWANVIVDNVDAIHLLEDSDSAYAHANNMYYNTYQPGGYEVVNHTIFEIDLTGNYWAYTDSLIIAGLIYGPAYFCPFAVAPIDTVPGEPSAATSVTVMEDRLCTVPFTGPAALGDTLFIELEGTDWNGLFVEPALVIITSDSDPAGIAVALVESGPATGIYAGEAYVDSLSDDLGDAIGVSEGDQIRVAANVDPSVYYTVSVPTAGVDGIAGEGLDSGPMLQTRNHPDPFSDLTEINYTVPACGRVRVTVYDVSGRLVAALVDEWKPAGSYLTSWGALGGSGGRMAGGIYFCRVAADGIETVDKMILLK